MLIAPSLAFAWGGDGHQLVCMIAEYHLTPVAKANVHDLLGKDINISDFGIANWADEVRRDRPETGPWHYVDIPTDAKAFDKKRDGQDGNNVIDKITDFQAVLKDPKASRTNRVEALKFLVHFVGDLHQPLHCAERNKDRGGNDYQVYFLKREFPINLHSVWDGAILLTRRDTMLDTDYAKKLNIAITPQQIKDWSKGTPTDWANESHDVAVNSAYKDLPPVGPYPKLDQKYVDTNGPIVDQQLERAGIRLANILNDIFTAMPVSTTSPATTQP
jgi:hypothetical protein